MRRKITVIAALFCVAVIAFSIPVVAQNASIVGTWGRSIAGYVDADNTTVLPVTPTRGLPVSVLDGIEIGDVTVDVGDLDIGTVDQGDAGTAAEAWYVRYSNTAGTVTAGVLAEDPTGTEGGLITRNIPSGTQAVSLAAPVDAAQSGEWTVGVDGTVAATQSGNWSTRLQDGAGNDLLSTTTAPASDARGLVVRPVGGSFDGTVDQGEKGTSAEAWYTEIVTGGNVVGAENRLPVDIGDVTVDVGDLEIGTVDQGEAGSAAEAWFFRQVDSEGADVVTSGNAGPVALGEATPYQRVLVVGRDGNDATPRQLYVDGDGFIYAYSLMQGNDGTQDNRLFVDGDGFTIGYTYLQDGTGNAITSRAVEARRDLHVHDEAVLAAIEALDIGGGGEGSVCIPDIYANPVALTACAADGSTTDQLDAGQYLLMVSGEGAFFQAGVSSLAGGGAFFVSGTQRTIEIGADDTDIACRSVGGTGRVEALPCQ